MSKDPSVLLLEHHLKALKLPTLLRDYVHVAFAKASNASSMIAGSAAGAIGETTG